MRDGQGNSRTERLAVDLASAAGTADRFHAGEVGLVGDQEAPAPVLLKATYCPICSKWNCNGY